MTGPRLFLAACARHADLYYASRFRAPDPFPFFQVGRERVIIVSDLELGRARTQAAVETVLPLRTYEDRAKGRVPQPTMLDAVEEALRERGIGRLLVPGSFPAEYVDKLRDRGFTLQVKEGIFFEERLTKSEAEVAWITEALRVAEEAMGIAIQAIREAEIRGHALYRAGAPLTSEAVRRLIHHLLLDRDCIADHTIVAGGEHGSDPHHEGTGPLPAHAPLVIDIFPRSTRTHYFGDLTRTVLPGRAPEHVRQRYGAGPPAQEQGFSLIRDAPGGDGALRGVGLFHGGGERADAGVLSRDRARAGARDPRTAANRKTGGDPAQWKRGDCRARSLLSGRRRGADRGCRGGDGNRLPESDDVPESAGSIRENAPNDLDTRAAVSYNADGIQDSLSLTPQEARMALKLPIYMDYHATTPVDPEVLEAMLPYFREHFGNPSSRTHVFGWTAEAAVEKAREQLSTLIGCKPMEVVFTSGATESNNLAVKGIAWASRDRGNHIITTGIEHHAVLDTCRRLEKEGCDVTYLPVDRSGLVNPVQVEQAITDRTILVSVIAAHNEIGTIQPLAEIGRICKARGVPFHADAAQALGRISLRVDDVHANLLSFSAHKLYGPKGVGALYVRNARPAVKLIPLIDG